MTEQTAVPTQPTEATQLPEKPADAVVPTPTPEAPVAAKASPTISIAEVFLSTQGEGPLIGTPSVFLRTNGCNLRCRFTNPVTGKTNLCDTAYTSWNPSGTSKSPQEIYDEVVKLALTTDGTTKRKNPITHIVITGGEPCLYGQEMSDLILGFLVTGFHITVETNGTKYIEVQSKQKTKEGKEVDLTGNLLFSISPKLKSSTPFGTEHEKSHTKTRINQNVLEALLKRYPSYLKFVMSTDEDLEEINEIRGKLNLSAHRVFLMPEGVTREEIIANGPKTHEICIANGFRYSPREHIVLFDTKRGV